jgi:hypothetical protein
MKSFLLCGIAIASVLMLQSVPASAQRVHGTSHAHIGHGYAGCQEPSWLENMELCGKEAT